MTENVLVNYVYVHERAETVRGRDHRTPTEKKWTQSNKRLVTF